MQVRDRTYKGNHSESCGRVCPKEGEEDGRQTPVDEAKHSTNHSEESKDVETLPGNTGTRELACFSKNSGRCDEGSEAG